MRFLFGRANLGRLKSEKLSFVIILRYGSFTHFIHAWRQYSQPSQKILPKQGVGLEFKEEESREAEKEVRYADPDRNMSSLKDYCFLIVMKVSPWDNLRSIEQPSSKLLLRRISKPTNIITTEGHERDQLEEGKATNARNKIYCTCDIS